MNRSPDQLMPTLFEAVQRSALFEDSKTFVDALPLRSARAIEADYCAARAQPGFALRDFVQQNFTLPADPAPAAPAAGETPEHYLDGLWSQLQRPADRPQVDSSLLPLPHSYVVPGGRFREIYYWDSYFTILGLAACGRWQAVRHMVDNFAHLIAHYGHVPNGNRTYYLSRSQPPLFALMVQCLADQYPDEPVLERYRPALVREYDYWMQGWQNLTQVGQAHRRVLRHPRALLNRYWDDAARPRPESYREDRVLAQGFAGDEAALYRNLRAACETGWDFSSRWLRVADDLHSCRTVDIVPIDLNCILVLVEQTLARACAGQAAAALYSERAAARAAVLREHFFCAGRGQFVDCLLPDFSHSERSSLATSWPLFARVASQPQAEQVSATLARDYLRPGGWVTTQLHTGQQWDAPNGWAPLQWVTFRGLQNYGHQAGATEGAQRWLANNLACFRRTGSFYEKYDVEQPGTIAGGGEYPVQLGFGWTNAVYLLLQAELQQAGE